MTLHERFSCCVFFLAQNITIQHTRTIRADELLKMKSETNNSKPHIVLCAPKKTGKTTLIERIIRDAGAPAAGSPIPVYGFQTKRFAGSDGINRIYMFPAGQAQTETITPDARYLGSTCGRVRDVCAETFDTYGTTLIQSARPDGLLVMDEIGHMEKDSPLFLQAIFESLDGDIPILASVRYTVAPIDCLERIKRHPRVRLYMLTEENRDAVYIEIRNALLGDIADRKEERDREPI